MQLQEAYCSVRIVHKDCENEISSLHVAKLRGLINQTYKYSIGTHTYMEPFSIK